METTEMKPSQVVSEIAEKLAIASQITAHANDPEMLIEALSLVDEARTMLAGLAR